MEEQANTTTVTTDETLVTPRKKTAYAGIDSKMLKYSLILDNLQSVSEAKQLAQAVGYPATKVKEGTALYDRCAELIEQHAVSKGRKQALNDAFKSLRGEVHRDYMYHLTVARRVLAGNAEYLNAIRAIGQRAQRFSRWLEDVQIFYDNIIQTPELLALFASSPLDDKQFKATQKKVSDLVALNMDRHQQQTESQRITKEKTEVLAALGKWIGDFKVVARSRYLQEPDKRLVLGV